MNKTIKQTERYEAPKSKMFTVVVQQIIAQSPDGNNPGAIVPDLQDGGELE